MPKAPSATATDGASLHFLAKPFSLKQLAAKVKDVLAEGRVRICNYQ